MGVLTRSLWLPIGRANFFSVMTDPDLLGERAGVEDGQCRSTRQDANPVYVPFLRESVFRRLVEVLPVSFGYDHVGRCEFSEQHAWRRPLSLTMALRPRTTTVALASAKVVNDQLGQAGVDTVTLRIDENGFYTFTACWSGGDVAEDRVEAATPGT